MIYVQRPLPNYVHVVVDYKYLGDFRWCLILNSRPHYCLNATINITPSYKECHEARVDDCNGTILIARGLHLLDDDKIIGSLVYSYIDFSDVASWLTFKEQRDHGCFINDMIRILKDNGINASPERF